MGNKESIVSPEMKAEIAKRTETKYEREVQKMRGEKQVEERPILPPVSTSCTKGPKGKRVSSRSKVPNSKRVSGGKQKKVSNDSLSLNQSISQYIKKILRETNEIEGCTYAESIARRVVENAANQGVSKDIEFVADRTEGKPGQAAKSQEPIDEVEGDIQRDEISLINSLLE